MRRWRGGGPASLLALLGCAGCTLAVRASGGVLGGRWGLYALLVLWLALAAVAALLTDLALPRRAAVLGVAGSALALHALALTAGPQLSDDLYRYVWDARVAATGTDPYRYAPDDPALAGLRDPALWPSPQECARVRSERPDTARTDPFPLQPRPPGCSLINRAGVRTIYPPAAQLAFRGAAAVTAPVRSVELRVQLPAAAVSLALTAGLVLALRATGRGPGGALLHAASPLAGVEAVMDGHVDVLAAVLGLGLVAVLARERRGPALPVAAGVLLAAATLVKLYPAALAVVVAARWGWRSARTWAAAAAAVVTTALLYAPHVIDVGAQVLGYLPGYLRENGYDSGERYLLVPLPAQAAPAGVALGLAALVAWGALRPVPADLAAVAARAAAVLGGAFLLLTPGNAWYCTLLVACAVVGRRPEWLLVVVAGWTVYFRAVLDDPSPWPRVSYVVAALAVLVAAAVRSRARWGRVEA